MKLCLSIFAAVCLCLPTNSNAAICNFSGEVLIDGSAVTYGDAGIGDFYALTVAFNSVADGGVNGLVIAVSLSVGAETWNLGGRGIVSIVDNFGSDDSIRVDLQLADSAPSAFAGGDFDLSIFAPGTTVTDSLLTQANLAPVKDNATFGNFLWVPSGTFNLQGNVAVPEPSFVLMMTGIGCFLVLELGVDGSRLLKPLTRRMSRGDW